MYSILTKLTDKNELSGIKFEGASYFPAAPEDEQRARVLLGCDGSYGFYTPVILVRAIQAHSWLWSLVGQDNSHYGKFLDSLPLFYLTNNVTLSPETTGADFGAYVRYQMFPVADYMDIVLSGSSAQLSLAYGIRPTETVDILDQDTDGNVSIDWPSWTGIKGVLNMGAETETRLYFRPLNISWGLAADKLNNNASGLSNLLQKHGLSSGFYKADSDLEKVATVATAVVLNNNDIRF